jgi:hypothetical protein
MVKVVKSSELTHQPNPSASFRKGQNGEVVKSFLYLLYTNTLFTHLLSYSPVPISLFSTTFSSFSFTDFHQERGNREE